MAKIHEIVKEGDRILQDRIGQISSKEQECINNYIEQRQDQIKRVQEEGNLYMKECEKKYKEKIDEFIKNLEIEMSNNLEKLQTEINNKKNQIIEKSLVNIEKLRKRAENTKMELLDLVRSRIDLEQKDIMKNISDIYTDRTLQTLGFEQFRTLTLKIYSTVGTNKGELGCQNIKGREEFINDINKRKDQVVKRTVYIENIKTLEEKEHQQRQTT